MIIVLPKMRLGLSAQLNMTIFCITALTTLGFLTFTAQPHEALPSLSSATAASTSPQQPAPTEAKRKRCKETGSHNFDDEIQRTKSSCQTIYYEVLQKRELLFDPEYSNQLILATDVDSDFPVNGEMLLRLVSFLEEKSFDEGECGKDARYLLSKINKLFYLIFHRSLARVEAPKERQAALVKAFHRIYRCSAGGGESQESFHPFRPTLTRMAISLLMLDFSRLAYDVKKEQLLFQLEKFRKQLEEINESLPTAVVDGNSIDLLIDTLEAYYIFDPLLGKPRDVKKRVIILLITLTAVGIATYLLWRYREPIVQSMQDFVSKITAAFSKTVREEFAKPVVKEMKDQLLLGKTTDADGRVIETHDGLNQMTQQLADQLMARIDNAQLAINQIVTLTQPTIAGINATTATLQDLRQNVLPAALRTMQDAVDAAREIPREILQAPAVQEATTTIKRLGDTMAPTAAALQAATATLTRVEAAIPQLLATIQQGVDAAAGLPEELPRRLADLQLVQESTQTLTDLRRALPEVTSALREVTVAVHNVNEAVQHVDQRFEAMGPALQKTAENLASTTAGTSAAFAPARVVGSALSYLNPMRYLGGGGQQAAAAAAPAQGAAAEEEDE